jgi:hypothetical protein
LGATLLGPHPPRRESLGANVGMPKPTRSSAS